MKHYYAFEKTAETLKDGELNSAESWDTLRESHPHFSIGQSREEWLSAARGEIKKDGQDGGMLARAREVTQTIQTLGVESVFSVGVGGAGLEYNIKKILPDVKMICSEYSPVAVARLQKVFTEADGIVQFDMKDGDWKSTLSCINPAKQIVLMYRVDIHVTDTELRKMFRDMHSSGVQNILIILCGVVTLRGVFNRLRKRASWLLSCTPYSFAGYLRSYSTFPSFWHGLYDSTSTQHAGLPGFLLKRKF